MQSEWEVFMESLLNPPKVEQLPPPARSGNVLVSAAICIPFCLVFLYVLVLAVRAAF